MRIYNVRLGFANNSSSSHSLIFIRPGTRVEDYDIDEKEFGWEFFTAASNKSKLDYLALTLWYNLRHICSPEMASAVIEAWVPRWEFPLEKAGDTLYPEGHIDHQSVMTLPLTWDGKGIDKEFFGELSSYLQREDIAILGGNDNADNDHPLYSRQDDAGIPLPRDMGSTPYVARKDKRFGFWTLFDRENGGKIRFTFGRGKIRPEKAYAPELVDVKITDYCPYGCQFCYQDSHIKGEHAPVNRIYQLFRALGKMKVFEVALGGGEPTLHPGFLSIIRDARSYGLVPNFTTRNLSWLHDHKFRRQVEEYCGSFAYSSSSPEEVLTLAGLIKTYGLKNPVSVQCIAGVISPFEFESLLECCYKARLNLTILGYKDVGRGCTYAKRSEEGLFGVIQRVVDSGKFPNISIDTLVAEQWEPRLKKMGIPSWMYHKKEGAFSCYVDAVARKIGPSSYCKEEEYSSLANMDEKNYYMEEALYSEILGKFEGF